MKIMLKNLKLLTVLFLAASITGCSDDDNNNDELPEVPTTVVDIALANGLTSLAAALQATDLVSTLEGTGPFTVFAPTNDAFADLLETNGLDLNNLTESEEELVKNILLNHVIVGEKIEAETLINAGSGYKSTASPGPATDTTLSLYYNVVDGVVELNGGSDLTDGADVTTPNVSATNGIIHIVDAVIGLPTISTFATTNTALSVLVDVLEYAYTGMPTVPYIDTVSDSEAGPYTVFAPNNDAFDDLLVELDITELANLGTGTVDAVLLNHIVDANVQSNQLPNGIVSTLGGDITADNTTFTLTDGLDRDINIIQSLVDIQATNGVIHVIDKVIRPVLENSK